MATFYVGQRVRYVRAIGPSISGLRRDPVIVPIGEQGTVRYVGEIRAGDFGLYIEFDNYRSTHYTGYFTVLTSMVEPLQPEGWQVTDWSECLWQPEGIAA